MSEDQGDRESFSLGSDFEGRVSTQSLALGPLELQYQDLFAEALEDGVITADERKRLDRAAANLGLNKERLDRLEDAMTAAYESHHRVRVVNHALSPHASLTPLLDAPPLSTGTAPSAQAPPSSSTSKALGQELALLRKENSELRARIGLLEEELKRAQAAINVEVDLSDLDLAAGDSLDPEEAWRRVRQDPANPGALRQLSRAYQEAGDWDGAFLCAQALLVLDQANDSERALTERYQKSELIAPSRSFDEMLWSSNLFHPEHENVTGAIFGLVTPAILVGRVTTLRRDGLLQQPSPENKQNIAESTVMSVRAVGWAAALLGLNSPPVYVDPKADVGYAHITAMPPFTLLGNSVLSGRGILELAFLVGQHLTFYRSEYFVRTLFPGTEDLEDLFLSALLIANPKLPLKGAKRARVEPLARAIEPLLEASQIDTLRGLYLRFAEEGGRTNLMRYSSASEKTAARVGLSLCQDLPTAWALLAKQEGPTGQLALDLIPFATGQRFLALRRNLGIAVHGESSSS